MPRLQTSIPYLALFFCTLTLISIFKYPFQELSDYRDPYYHIAHANAYLHNTELSYPQLTYFSVYPADLWLGYHWLLAASFIGTEPGDSAAQITRTILIHMILSAVLMVAIARLGVVYFRSIAPFYRQKLQTYGLPTWQPRITETAFSILIISSIFLFSLNFFFRALLQERPHVLMILFVILGLLCVIQHRYKLLLLLSGLSALCYSMSLLIFLPALVILVGYLIVDRSVSGLQESMTPFFYTLGGYVIGLVVHPDTWGYLLNGVVFTTLASLDSLLWFLPIGTALSISPTEMLPQTYSVWGLYAPLVLLAVIIWYRFKESTRTPHNSEHWTRLEAGLCGVACGLGLVSLMINRAVEYAAPLLFISTLAFSCSFLPALFLYIHQQLTRTALPISHQYRSFVTVVKKIPPVIIRGTLSGLFALSISLSLLLLYTVTETPSIAHDHLKEAVLFIASQPERELVALGSFDLYPQAILYGPTIEYANGMDARMQYFFHPQSGEQLEAFLLSLRQTESTETTSSSPDPETVRVFLKQHNITHLLLDLSENETASRQAILHYPFLELLYKSEKYPAVHVYKVAL